MPKKKAGPARKKPGPKPTVTDTVKAQVILHLKLGLSQADALLCCDVSYDAFRRAKKDDPEFARGVKAASARGKAHHLKRVTSGEAGWQSSAWFLERKYGEEFGQKQRLEHSGPKGGPVQITALEVVRPPATDTPADAD